MIVFVVMMMIMMGREDTGTSFTLINPWLLCGYAAIVGCSYVY